MLDNRESVCVEYAPRNKNLGRGRELADRMDMRQIVAYLRDKRCVFMCQEEETEAAQLAAS